MHSPSGETELRRLRGLVSTGKHYKDAYEASELRLVPAEYSSALFAVYHVAHYGVSRGSELVDQGHPQSKPPVYDRRAMALLDREQARCGAIGYRLLLTLDDLVGEAPIGSA